MSKQHSPAKKGVNLKILLPCLAAVMVVIAVVVVLVIPRGGEKSASGARALQADASGRVVIRADSLSSDQVSFLRLSDSAIELLARKGADGTASVALGTCQSCNGSPMAYYTQVGGELQCNNCGLTFPLEVLDAPGGGCHPIMISGDALSYEGADAVLDVNALKVYEELFAKVASH